MNPDDERLTRQHEALVERIEQLVSGDDFIRFVAESARFHHYSPQNRLLIVCQLVDRGVEPNGLTASYKTWTRVPAEGGGTCQVAKGEKALWIYAPLTATQRVIDDQTGEERVASLPAFAGSSPCPYSTNRNSTGHRRCPNHRHLSCSAVTTHRRECGMPSWPELALDGYTVGLVERAPGATWNGQTSFTSREVRVHEDLQSPQRLKTLLHEWAHATMGHETRFGETRRHIAEVEAESVAYLMCERVGVDSQQYTVPYVSGWAGSVEVVKATAERVLGATSKLIDRLENRLAIDLTPDLLALAQTGPVTTTVEDHLARAGDRLLPADRAELLGRAAPQRIAALLASAGFDASQTATTFRQLGVDRQTASIAMTAIHPYNTVDHAAEPLYDPTTVRSVLADAYSTPTPTPSEGHGLRLIQKWAQLTNSPANEAAIPTR